MTRHNSNQLKPICDFQCAKKFGIFRTCQTPENIFQQKTFYVETNKTLD